MSDLPPANPLTCRVAGAMLLALALWQVLFAPAFAARLALGIGLDPTSAASPLVGAVFGLGAFGAAGAIALGSAVAGVTLLIRPEIGRFPGFVAALVWTPLGCGVVGLVLAGLLAIPGEARPPTSAP